MNDILIAALVLGGMGLILGAALAAASVVFRVKTDERITRISECLSGANCGGCGYSGCDAYAKAIVENGAEINKCTAGGQTAVDKIAAIMGISSQKAVCKRAYVMCSGSGEAVNKKYSYYGVNACEAAARLGGGSKACAYSCVGLGSCKSVCVNGAISIVDNVAVVDPEKCLGCGACVLKCPKKVIRLVDLDSKYSVACSSKDSGKDTVKACKAGCIACGICVKNCPSGAVSIQDNTAVIDHTKCTSCGICAQKCPRKIIKS